MEFESTRPRTESERACIALLQRVGKAAAEQILHSLCGWMSDPQIEQLLKENGVQTKRVHDPSPSVQALLKANPFNTAAVSSAISFDGTNWLDVYKVQGLYEAAYRNALVPVPLAEMTTLEQVYRVQDIIQDYVYTIERQIEAAKPAPFVEAIIRRNAYQNIAFKCGTYLGQHGLEMLRLGLQGSTLTQLLQGVETGHYRDVIDALEQNKAHNIVPIVDVVRHVQRQYENMAEQETEKVLYLLEKRFPGIHDAEFDGSGFSLDPFAEEYLSQHPDVFFKYGPPHFVPGWQHFLSYYFAYRNYDRVWRSLDDVNVDPKTLDRVSFKRLDARMALINRIPETAVTEHEARVISRCDDTKITFE